MGHGRIRIGEIRLGAKAAHAPVYYVLPHIKIDWKIFLVLRKAAPLAMAGYVLFVDPCQLLSPLGQNHKMLKFSSMDDATYASLLPY